MMKKTVLRKTKWAGRIAQWVKVCAAKPEGIHVIQWDPYGGRRKLTPSNGPLSSPHPNMYLPIPTRDSRYHPVL